MPFRCGVDLSGAAQAFGLLPEFIPYVRLFKDTRGFGCSHPMEDPVWRILAFAMLCYHCGGVSPIPTTSTDAPRCLACIVKKVPTKSMTWKRKDNLALPLLPSVVVLSAAPMPSSSSSSSSSCVASASTFAADTVITATDGDNNTSSGSSSTNVSDNDSSDDIPCTTSKHRASARKYDRAPVSKRGSSTGRDLASDSVDNILEPDASVLTFAAQSFAHLHPYNSASATSRTEAANSRVVTLSTISRAQATPSAAAHVLSSSTSNATTVASANSVGAGILPKSSTSSAQRIASAAGGIREDRPIMLLQEYGASIVLNPMRDGCPSTLSSVQVSLLQHNSNSTHQHSNKRSSASLEPSLVVEPPLAVVPSRVVAHSLLVPPSLVVESLPEVRCMCCNVVYDKNHEYESAWTGCEKCPGSGTWACHLKKCATALLKHEKSCRKFHI